MVGAVAIGVGVTKSRKAATGGTKASDPAEVGDDSTNVASGGSGHDDLNEAAQIDHYTALKRLLFDIDLDAPDDDERKRRVWQNTLVMGALEAGEEIRIPADGTPFINIPHEVIHGSSPPDGPFGTPILSSDNAPYVAGHESGPQYWSGYDD